MMSGVSAGDRTSARILDAAVQVLIDFGVKRATVDMVAKYADVSHMTVYRRWPARNDLLRAAVEREFATVLDAAFDAAGDRDGFEDKVVGAFGALVWSVHTHPLTARELRTEPETVLPLLTTGSAPAMTTAVALVAERVRRTADDCGVQVDDPDALADILVRLAHSLLLVPHPGRPLASRADVDEYARRYVAPLTRSAIGVGV
jgi:AcrR family transcriptional regulator